MLRLNGVKVAEFVPEIADNLTTDDSTKALSAKQGKVLNDIVSGKELLADVTQSDTEYDLAKPITDYKMVIVTSYYNQFILASVMFFVSEITFNLTHFPVTFNDGTLRKGQVFFKSANKVASTSTSWQNITGVKVYGIK